VPKIRWESLPLHLKQHLVERLREREITKDDLEALRQWISTDPEVPEGPWWKNFGTFKLTRECQYPKTLLKRDQAAFGKEL
jgi:hypothetical protein